MYEGQNRKQKQTGPLSRRVSSVHSLCMTSFTDSNTSAQDYNRDNKETCGLFVVDYSTRPFGRLREKCREASGKQRFRVSSVEG